MTRPNGSMTRRFFSTAMVISLSIPLFAATSPIKAAQISVTDVTGRRVVLEQTARRIMIDDGRYLIALSLIHPDPVSLLSAWPQDINRIGPFVYEQYAKKFPGIVDLAKVASSANTISVEQVLAAEPDLAVFSLQSKPSDTDIARLEAAGIAVATIDFFNNPLENLEPGLRLLAAVTGREAEAEAFIAFRRERMEAISAKLKEAGLPRRTVFLEPHAARTAECCASPGRGNIGKYIDFAGGENIGDAVIPGITGTLNPEYVIETDPDVYIATGGPHMAGTNGLLIGPGYDEATVRRTLEQVVSRTAISGLKAVREGQVHGLAHQLLNSPLDILTIEALAKWIHPDLFADLDLEVTRNALNSRFLAVPVEGIYQIDRKAP